MGVIALAALTLFPLPIIMVMALVDLIYWPIRYFINLGLKEVDNQLESMTGESIWGILGILTVYLWAIPLTLYLYIIKGEILLFNT